MEKTQVALVGIIGIAGIGKSTLANALFNSIRCNFERASYIEDIQGQVEKNGLLEVQRKLLLNLLHNDYHVPDLSHRQAEQIIRKRLRNIDGLILFDNIEDYKQLDAILPPDVLFPGSTVIVTSRDSNIFKSCNNFLKYEMTGLNRSQCKELFCLHAFNRGVACAPFENMVEMFVGVCKGIPLALEVCGRELYCESYAIWESYLKKMTETMLVELKSILQVLYSRLDEKQKQIFLDIAIFFHGENVRTIEIILEEESKNSFAYDLLILERKCMIKKLEMGVLTMHGAFRDLGRAIVDEESPTNPGARSRLWRPSDIKKVLQSFKVPLELQVLNLQRCYKLQRVPDSIGSFRALQKLDFSECLLLKTLSEEFCNLESLEVLHLNRCLNLEYLPSGFGGMRRLRDVSLRACEKLKALPESFGLLPQIEYLDMRHCTNVKIEEGSFGSISTLKEVYLLNCRKLETFPTQLTRQPSLKKLGVATGGFQRSRGIAGLGHNDILIDIPENIGDLSMLTELRLGNLTGIPQSIGNLSQLVRLHLWGLANMRAIPDSIGLNNLRLLEELPTSIGNLSCLSHLELKDCPRLQELPTSICNLSCLSRLFLWKCPRLQELPTSIGNLSCLSELRLEKCPRLQELPTSIGNLSCLSKLRLDNCPRLQELPTSIGNLSCLSRLKLLDLPLTDSFLREENSVLLENLISPSLDFKFTASPIPYPTAWLDVYHFQMMDTIPFVSGSSGLKCSLPAATTKERAAIIICFVSVLQLQKNELNDNQLNDNQLEWCSFSPQLRFEWFSGEKEYEDIGIKLGERIHLKILSAEQHTDLGESSGLNVFMKTMSSSVKGYFKCGWFKIIRKGEEKLIQQICGDFFRELRRQRPWALARASAASQLDLGNVHALDIANCTIRRTLYLYKTPIQEEKMELVLRKKQLFWRDDKELEHLDLSIMNTTSIPLFLTLKSIVNLYNMEVIISVRSVEAYKDKLQEYQDNSVIESHANIPVQVAKIFKSRNESILEVK